jgi:death-on-curing protein
MRYLTLGEIVFLHRSILEATRGLGGLRDVGALESAVAQPRASSGGSDLHASPIDKAAALCFSIVRNHHSSTATSGLCMRQWRRSSS